MTVIALSQPWWVDEKRRLIHSQALPKQLRNIPRQLPGELVVGETKTQEPRRRPAKPFPSTTMLCFPLRLLL